MGSRTLTDEQRAERRERERELVLQSVDRLRSSDGSRQWLKTRARFRSYSYRNTLLIAAQRPTAERVAGFRAWLALNYCVRRVSARSGSGRHARRPTTPSSGLGAAGRESGHKATDGMAAGRGL